MLKGLYGNLLNYRCCPRTATSTSRCGSGSQLKAANTAEGSQTVLSKAAGSADFHDPDGIPATVTSPTRT